MGSSHLGMLPPWAGSRMKYSQAGIPTPMWDLLWVPGLAQLQPPSERGTLSPLLPQGQLSVLPPKAALAFSVCRTPVHYAHLPTGNTPPALPVAQSRCSHQARLGLGLGLGLQYSFVQMNPPHLSSITPSWPITTSNKGESSHWSSVSDFETSTWRPVSKFPGGSVIYPFWVPQSKLPINHSVTIMHRKFLLLSPPLPTDWESLKSEAILYSWLCHQVPTQRRPQGRFSVTACEFDAQAPYH